MLALHVCDKFQSSSAKFIVFFFRFIVICRGWGVVGDENFEKQMCACVEKTDEDKN